MSVAIRRRRSCQRTSRTSELVWLPTQPGDCERRHIRYWLRSAVRGTCGTLRMAYRRHHQDGVVQQERHVLAVCALVLRTTDKNKAVATRSESLASPAGRATSTGSCAVRCAAVAGATTTPPQQCQRVVSPSLRRATCARTAAARRAAPPTGESGWGPTIRVRTGAPAAGCPIAVRRFPTAARCRLQW